MNYENEKIVISSSIENINDNEIQKVANDLVSQYIRLIKKIEK